MARMWMVRGEGGSLYDAFRERGVAAVGWNQLAVHAKPGVRRKQLIALYQSAEPQAKQGTVVSDAAIEPVLKQAESLSIAWSK